MPLLALDRARLRFGGIVALDDVSLAVDEGSIAGLIGPNGAGKTTAFNAITRLYKLDSGDVVFDGRSLRRVRPSRVIRLGIARTFQNLELFPQLTVLENVLVGAHISTRLRREREQRRQALETLADVGIAEHADSARHPACRTERSSASSSHEHSRAGRGCCCSTSRPAASTTRRSTRSSTSFAACVTSASSRSSSSSTTCGS